MRFQDGTLPRIPSCTWLHSGLPTTRSTAVCRGVPLGLVLYENRQARRANPFDRLKAEAALRSACRDQLRGGNLDLLFRYMGTTTDLSAPNGPDHGLDPESLIPASYFQTWLLGSRTDTAFTAWESLPLQGMLDSTCLKTLEDAAAAGACEDLILKGLGPKGLTSLLRDHLGSLDAKYEASGIIATCQEGLRAVWVHYASLQDRAIAELVGDTELSELDRSQYLRLTTTGSQLQASVRIPCSGEMCISPSQADPKRRHKVSLQPSTLKLMCQECRLTPLPLCLNSF